MPNTLNECDVPIPASVGCSGFRTCMWYVFPCMFVDIISYSSECGSMLSSYFPSVSVVCFLNKCFTVWSRGIVCASYMSLLYFTLECLLRHMNGILMYLTEKGFKELCLRYFFLMPSLSVHNAYGCSAS